MQNSEKKIVILGASRGLGWATYLRLNENLKNKFLLVSRKIQNNQVDENTKKITQDFSKNTIDTHFLNQMIEFNPTEIIYCAGGGPYGTFENKKWSDHEWALNVNFLYPARLVHQILNQQNKFQNLKSMTFVGSDIAENKPDENASSYSAAKHALRGLVTTLQKELLVENSSKIQIKLFSPGYMLTDLLPLNSRPRLENKAADPREIAEKLIEFIDSDQLLWPIPVNR